MVFKHRNIWEQKLLGEFQVLGLKEQHSGNNLNQQSQLYGIEKAGVVTGLFLISESGWLTQQELLWWELQSQTCSYTIIGFLKLQVSVKLNDLIKPVVEYTVVSFLISWCEHNNLQLLIINLNYSILNRQSYYIIMRQVQHVKLLSFPFPFLFIEHN